MDEWMMKNTGVDNILKFESYRVESCEIIQSYLFHFQSPSEVRRGVLSGMKVTDLGPQVDVFFLVAFLTQSVPWPVTSNDCPFR